MNIGVFGGTFDPPHNGHIKLAEAAIEQLALDEVLFLPARKNPLKPRQPVATAKQRLAMLEEVIKMNPKFSVCDIEIMSPEPSFSANTLKQLSLARPAKYWFLMGSDSLAEISRWYRPDELLRLARLGVFEREGYSRGKTMNVIDEEAKRRVDWIEAPLVPYSSTDIRQRIETGLSVATMVPKPVLAYIEEHGLYR
jgi:nicotinate-nucleotide adenylyltransferase